MSKSGQIWHYAFAGFCSTSRWCSPRWSGRGACGLLGPLAEDRLTAQADDGCPAAGVLAVQGRVCNVCRIAAGGILSQDRAGIPGLFALGLLHAILLWNRLLDIGGWDAQMSTAERLPIGVAMPPVYSRLARRA